MPRVTGEELSAAARAVATLSPRERVVFDLLGQGAGGKGLARDLGISMGTLKHHLSSIYLKLDLTNGSTEAAALSARLDMLATWPIFGSKVLPR